MNRAKRIQRAKDTQYYPLALNLKNKPAVVAGGGKVALMKVKALLQASAKVTVVSPLLVSELKRLNDNSKIEWLPRKIRSSDLNKATIVIAATSDENVNKQISNWANKKKILVNIVDKPSLSNFISPAVFRKKEATVAIYTNGVSPTFSRDIKNFLNAKWDEFMRFRKKTK